jgi:hypothetical protein
MKPEEIDAFNLVESLKISIDYAIKENLISESTGNLMKMNSLGQILLDF